MVGQWVTPFSHHLLWALSGAICDLETQTCVEQTEFAPLSFSASAAAPPLPRNPFPPPPAVAAADASPVLKPDIGTFWGLLVLGLCYLHHSTTGFALPALLPLISVDLDLNDSQSALLTAGYAVRPPQPGAGTAT